MIQRGLVVGVAVLLLTASAEAVMPLGDGGDSSALRLAGPHAAAPEIGDRASRPDGTPRGLILKLRQDADVCLSCRIGQGRVLGTLVPGSHLDALNRRFGVRSARPLLQARTLQGIPQGPKATAARRAELAQRFPDRARRASSVEAADFSRTYVLRTRRYPDMLAVARAFAADPAVEYCEPDYVMQTARLTDDPFLHSQGSWGQPFSDLWGVYNISAPAAWDVTRGAGVVVAIVDTGIDYAHPDIAANVWTNAGEIPDNGVDDDLNGYVDDVRGWNFVEHNSDPLDDNFHGTHVAGTVAALGDNGTGIVGVAYESRVMALRGIGTFGLGDTSDVVEAIEYAVDNGADVINASWTGSFSQTLADAVADAHAAGVVFVAAAGNASTDVAGYFPAALPQAIAVAALTERDVRADFSNFGVQLDVAAPGGGDEPPPDGEFPDFSVLSLMSGAVSRFIEITPKIILSDGGADYLRLAGTSMAAPHVAGVAALVLAADPTLEVEQVRQVLRTTADDLGSPGFDLDTGAGRVNAARAVLAPPPLVAIVTEPVVSGSLVGEVAVDVRGSARGPGFTSYTLEYRPAGSPDGWAPIVGPVSTPISDGLLGTWDVSALADGDYVLRLTAERSGETFTDHVPLTLVNVAIDSPPPLAALRNDHPIEIRGTAAGAGFVGYQVEYLRRAIDPAAWRTDGLTLAVPPGTPVRRGVLATLDASTLDEGDRFDFRLTVQNEAGASAVTRAGIVVDPTIKPGWPQPLVGVGDANYLTVADLDGDGMQEILIGSGDEVVIFEPDGSVRPGWPQSVATSEFRFVDTPGSPIVADIAGDSAPEVVATNRSQIFAWTGDGVPLAGFPLLAGNEYYHSSVQLTAGDRDGDGKDDIIAAGWGGIWFYRGDGTELPGSALLVTPPATSRIATTAAAQVVGDARVEVSRLDKTYLLKDRGEMSIVAPDGTAIAASKAKLTFFPHPAMADVDGDGLLELHWVSEKRYRDRMKVQGLSAYGRRVRTRYKRPRGGRGPRSESAQLSFADLDRDGFAEAYSYETRSPENYLPDEFGRFEDELGFIVIRRSKRAGSPLSAIGPNRLFQTSVPAGIAIGDVDGDGQQELVVGVRGRACGPGECRVYGGKNLLRAVVVQRPDGSMLSKFPKPLPQRVVDDTVSDFDPFHFSTYGDRRAETPVIADLDGDGLKEVLWVDITSDQLFVWDVAGTPGPLVADWPMYHHDPKHTNVLPVQ